MKRPSLLLLLGLCLAGLIFNSSAEDELEEGAHEEKKWGYKDPLTGKDSWSGKYATCGGLKQSPIAIDPESAAYSGLLRDQPIKLLGYDDPLHNTKVHITNNGHTATVWPGDYATSKIGMVGGALPGHYIMAQFHWHWGSTNDVGSEHTYAGKMYPMEMHFVHFNSRYLNNIEDVLGNEDGIAVLGVFVEVGEHNPAFDNIVQALSKTSLEGANRTSVPITMPNLIEFMPSDLTKYYRYEGSLTTPPCSEAVIWTVFKHTIQISQAQLDAFRADVKIDKSPNKTPSGDNLVNNNYRVVQPLNGRVVFVSYPDDTKGIVEDETLNLKNWGYYDTSKGPAAHQWGSTYRQCSGSRQSPIHIEHSATTYSPLISSSPWELTHYDTLPPNTPALLENNGHTAVVSLGEGVQVAGGGLPAKYRLLQFHIHWGQNNANGSEHLLDGVQYPAELHFVHSNMYYGEGKNIDQIHANHDGLAVLGVFMEVGKHNPDFDPIIKKLKDVKYSSAVNRVAVQLKTLRGLLPANMNEFYRYHGSLTTPPCYEIVVWTVFKNTIQISQEQLNQLRTQILTSNNPNATNSDLLGGEYGTDAQSKNETKPAKDASKAKKYIIDNFRPLQSINLRVVQYANIKNANQVGQAAQLSHLSAVCLFVCLAVLQYLI